MTQLRRASADLHGSKSLPAFARDEYYIGPIYKVTGTKGQPRQQQRAERSEGASRLVTRSLGGLAGVSAAAAAYWMAERLSREDITAVAAQLLTSPSC